MSKHCIRCNQLKHRFHKNPSMKDGFSVWCTDCLNDYYREYRKTHPRNISLERERKKRFLLKHPDYTKKYLWILKELPELNEIIPKVNNYEHMELMDRIKIHCLISKAQVLVSLRGGCKPNLYASEVFKVQDEVGQLSIKYDQV